MYPVGVILGHMTKIPQPPTLLAIGIALIQIIPLTLARLHVGTVPRQMIIMNVLNINLRHQVLIQLIIHGGGIAQWMRVYGALQRVYM